MNILKEKIAKAISNHISLEDTYTYELKRVKSAFEVGTMSLEDFEEWTEENVDDLAKAIVDVLQPQLNEQQQIAINNAKKSFEKGADLYDCAIDMMLYDGLTDKEWGKATLAFLLWVQKQGEEKC